MKILIAKLNTGSQSLHLRSVMVITPNSYISLLKSFENASEHSLHDSRCVGCLQNLLRASIVCCELCVNRCFGSEEAATALLGVWTVIASGKHFVTL
jgi:hypothetical protein